MTINRNILVNNSKKNYIVNVLYYLLLVVLLFFIATMPIGKEAYIRASMYAFIVLNVCIFALVLMINGKRSDKYSLLLIFLLILIIIYSLIYFDTLNIRSIAVVLGYISSYLIVFYSRYIKIRKELINVIALICVALSVLFILYFFSPIAYRYNAISDQGIMSEINLGSLTLGFPNPNTTASIISPISMVLIVLSKIYSNKYLKLILLFLSLVLLYFIFLTDSRSSFFAVSIFGLFVLLKINIKISKTLVVLILTSVFAFVFLYAYLFYQKIGFDWEILGKPFFSGRQEYLSNIFFDASNSWLIGDIRKYQYSNYLNGMLSIYASGGIVNVILYILFFSHNISKRYRKNNYYSYLALLAIVLFYFQSYAEGNFMVTGMYFSVLVSMLYVLTNIRVAPNSVIKK